MKTLRAVLGIVTVALLAAGYAASQYSLFNGSAAEYASRVDTPLVSKLALVLLIAIVVLGFIKEKAGDEAEDS